LRRRNQDYGKFFFYCVFHFLTGIVVSIVAMSRYIDCHHYPLHKQRFLEFNFYFFVLTLHYSPTV
jgi:hypothetical protein